MCLSLGIVVQGCNPTALLHYWRVCQCHGQYVVKYDRQCFNMLTNNCLSHTASGARSHTAYVFELKCISGLSFPALCVLQSVAADNRQAVLHGSTWRVHMCSSKDTRKVAGRAPADAAPQAVHDEQQSRKRNREEQPPHSRCVSSAFSTYFLWLMGTMCSSSVSHASCLPVVCFSGVLVIAFALRA